MIHSNLPSVSRTASAHSDGQSLASSIITVKQSASHGEESIQIQSGSTAEAALLAARALKAIPGQQKDSRSPNLVDQGLNKEERERSRRRSSNNSPPASPRLARDSSRSSPSRFQPPSAGARLSGRVSSRGGGGGTISPRFGKEGLPKLRLPLADINSHAHVRSPLSPPIMRPLTPSTTGLLTPNSGTEPSDYFGLGIAVSKEGSTKAEDASPMSPMLHSRYSSRRTRDGLEPGRNSTIESPRRTRDGLEPGRNSTIEWKPRDGLEPGRNSTIESPDNAKRRSQRKEKREKDKKTMLSKALEKANTAVLLDNAQNFNGALEAYKDACNLLQQVMDRTSGPEDKRKLDAIRETYTNRIEELNDLQQSPSENGGEKELPPRPMSNDSEDFAPQLDALKPMSPLQGPSSDVQEIAREDIAELPGSEAPRQTTSIQRTRDSFLTDVIRQVEGGSSGGFLGPLWEKSKSPSNLDMVHEQRSREELNGSDAPRPLRSVSPQPPVKDQSDVYKPTVTQPVELEGDLMHTPQPSEPSSWLNTIDESDSDRESSVHSAVGGKLRRKDLRSGGPNAASEFDAAFDAAVEAAYEDGYEPDQEPQSIVNPPQTGTDVNGQTKDYISHGFNFDLHNKSTPAQQSESGDITQGTWQSSARTTAGTNSTTLSESKIERKPVPVQEDSAPSTPAAAVAEDEASYTLPATAFERPDSTANVQILERRNRTPGVPPKNLKIDTFANPSPSLMRELSSSSRMTEPGTGGEPARTEVAPWEVADGKPPVPVTPRRTEMRSAEPQSARAEVAPWEVVEKKAEVTPWEVVDKKAEFTPWEAETTPEARVTRVGSLRRMEKDHLGIVTSSASNSTTDLSSPAAAKTRGQKSYASLRDANAADNESLHETASVGYGSIYARRNDSTSHLSQRSIPHTIGSIPPMPEASFQGGGGYHIFDTTLGRSSDQSLQGSPRTSKEYASPLPFEPCPDSQLLRPFWLLRSISNTATHPRGGYITNRLFMPHEAWLNKTVKFKNVEDKIAACDLLTAALERFSNVDTYDADAVLEAMQQFEDVMERVQTMLIKKLGNEVGVTGVSTLFREADKGGVESPTDNNTKESGLKSSSSKSVLSGWRKLRGKPSVSSTSTITSETAGKIIGRDSNSMSSVPMTSFSGVEKRTGHRRDALSQAIFEGPHSQYMNAVARVCEAAQVIDQIARQVEDPGLKHSSPTHVGLEFSTRHAAEFFGFYICRFLLTDVGTLIDKYVKRSTEWVLA